MRGAAICTRVAFGLALLLGSAAVADPPPRERAARSDPVGDDGAGQRGEVLYDNGEPDGSTAYSNHQRDFAGFHRSLLDDFVVPDGEIWRITGLRHLHLTRGVPQEGMELRLWSDADGAPAQLERELSVTSFRDEPTGRILFDRTEYEAWTTFEPVELCPGPHWLDGNVIAASSPDHWLVHQKVFWSECWVDYEGLGGLQPGSTLFGTPADLNFVIEGEVISSCPEDLDDSGAVDFGDILAILAAWGPCKGECPEDLDDSGAVDFGDILVVLAAWGPCV